MEIPVYPELVKLLILILLTQPPELWGFTHVPPWLASESVSTIVLHVHTQTGPL